MEFVRTENNAVVELISCVEKPKTGEWTEVTLDGGIRVGDDVRQFNTKWELRPAIELVTEGLIVLARAGQSDVYPAGTLLEKIVGNEVVQKNRYDFAKEGLIVLSPLEYLDDDTKEIKAAGSIEQLLAFGKVDQAKADALKGEEVRAYRDAELTELDQIVSNPLRWGSLSSELQNEYAQYRRDLLNVPQQAEFPWRITWPKVPLL